MKSIDVPTIPLNDAILRVTRFRETLAESVPQTNIPRAILIPIDDLLAIVERYSKIDDTGKITCMLQGVRAYFAIKVTDKTLPDDVTALIVPVGLKGNDIVSDGILGLGNPGDSEIYDFTKPCPTECDPESPLYIP
ncbi:MAG: hypothetical protein V4541_12625 [Bacteroidota bacterium]